MGKVYVRIFCICCVWIGIISTAMGQTAQATQATQAVLTAVDGPYLMYEKNGLRSIRVDEAGRLIDTTYAQVPENFSFRVYSQEGGHQFEVRLHPVSRPAWQYPRPQKVFVMSDIHGDFDCMVSLLRAGGIINAEYGWAYGQNHLVILGDSMDRGDDVLPIFWLMYKLEQEAAAAGGQFSFLLGNHEEMILRHNARYTNQKYITLAQQLNRPHQWLWRVQSVLGYWLATRNTMMTIGSSLFVHAGLSRQFLDLGLHIPEVNESSSRFLFNTREERAKYDLGAFMFGDFSPFWYRGMVSDQERYYPIEEADLDAALAFYRVERVFVGHTIFDEVSLLHGQKVIAVNVNNQKNRANGKSRAALWLPEGIFTLTDAGKLESLCK